jgi:hypothetical protein
VNNEIKEDEKEKKVWNPERENKVVVGRRKMVIGEDGMQLN